ncbi:thiamine-phosphate kinase [Halopseudomonas pelagia]|uniref:thiamine-phosphate kinase n=1 Tax=Halopseudomonas pelagia TaxID=553151 RepID=UPI00048BF0D4|nr:thiamine-phosphate kinase [Halopseudomonas pelagia]
MGEFDLIRRYFQDSALEAAGDVDAVTLGIGDDAALLRPEPGKQWVVSTDTLVLGTHFPEHYLPADLGYRALAVAVSDLAAMGARPLSFTLALTLPQADEGWLASFAEGLTQAAQDHRICLVGGDTTRGPLNVGVTVMGQVEPRRVVRRQGAQPGDLLCVGGLLGDGGAGLALVLGERLPDGLAEGERGYLKARFWRPRAQCELGLELAGIASAGIDISDGLLADAGHLASASGVGLKIRRADLPCSKALMAWPEAQRLEWMLSAGDDYVLLFTLPVASTAALAVWRSQGFAVSAIGQVVAGQGVWLDDGQALVNMDQPAGYQHFKDTPND